MKKFFWYVVIAVVAVLVLFRGVPMMMTWLSGKHSEKMRMQQEQAQKRAEELTRPAAKAAKDRTDWTDAIDSYSPPKVDAKGRTQRVMDDRGQQLDEAGEWE